MSDESALSRPQATPDPRIAEIREREQKATKGPWMFSETLDRQVMALWVPFGQTVADVIASLTADRQDDGEFIAHARQDIPYLLDALSALQQRVEHLQAAILPDWRTCGLSAEQIATLAEAHRQDTEVLDRCDEDDPRVLLRKAEQRVEQVTAERERLAEWKQDALAALNLWHALGDSLLPFSPGKLGVMIPTHLQDTIPAKLQAAESTIASLRDALQRITTRSNPKLMVEIASKALASLPSSPVSQPAETEKGKP